MKTKQLGFTLIELVVVIVLLGIIGAVATARFQDLAGDAADATEQGVAAEISSASAINYAASNLGGAAVAITGTVDCTATGANTVSDLLQTGLPANITLSDTATVVCGAAGDIVQCNVIHASGSGTNAVATVLCTG